MSYVRFSITKAWDLARTLRLEESTKTHKDCAKDVYIIIISLEVNRQSV